MRVLASVLLCCLLAASLASCSQESPAPPQSNKPTIPVPATGKSVVTGQVVSKSNQAPIKKTYVYLGRVFWDKDHTHAAFAVDLANSPVTKTDQNGFFSMMLVEPSEYVMVVGDYYGSNDAVREANGDARIYKPEAGKVLDVGVVQIDPGVEMP